MKEGKTKVRIRRSASEMYGLVLGYVESGQSQASFCMSQGLNLGTFRYWLRRYRADGGVVPGGFVAVALAGESPSARVELEYGSLRIRLTGVGAGYVAELAQKLAAGC